MTLLRGLGARARSARVDFLCAKAERLSSAGLYARAEAVSGRALAEGSYLAASQATTRRRLRALASHGASGRLTGRYDAA